MWIKICSRVNENRVKLNWTPSHYLTGWLKTQISKVAKAYPPLHPSHRIYIALATFAQNFHRALGINLGWRGLLARHHTNHRPPTRPALTQPVGNYKCISLDLSLERQRFLWKIEESETAPARPTKKSTLHSHFTQRPLALMHFFCAAI
jgi:hypothetical protein